MGIARRNQLESAGRSWDLRFLSSTGDQVTNLREDIFMHRIKYSLTSTMNEEERDMFLDKAVKALEK